MRAAIADGKDPTAERDRQKASPTVREYGDERYLVEYAEVHKKPRSVSEDRRT